MLNSPSEETSDSILALLFYSDTITDFDNYISQIEDSCNNGDVDFNDLA